VDCSTLTSQSHWEGALIGIPFVADNQRQAVSGKIIASVDKMIPGDVLVKYPSLDASPDKTWNHVGLYLGRDHSGEQWLIESTSKTGVRLAKVAEFNAQGGIKRFSLTTEVFSTDAARNALTLASMVPKFGRLGVRIKARKHHLRAYFISGCQNMDSIFLIFQLCSVGYPYLELLLIAFALPI